MVNMGFDRLFRGAAGLQRQDQTAEEVLALLLAEEQAYVTVLERELEQAMDAPTPAGARSGGVMFGTSSDVVAEMVDVVEASLRAGTGDLAASISFGFRDTPLTAEVGHLLCGLMAARRQLYACAVQNFDRCSDDTVCRYALQAALLAYLSEHHDRARQLIRATLADADAVLGQMSLEALLSFAQMSAAWGIAESLPIVDQRLETAQDPDPVLKLRLRFLISEFERQQAVAGALGCDPAYQALAEAAQSVGSEAGPEDPIRIGLFDYRSPTFPSKNIGDTFQTLGIVAQLRQYGFEGLKGPTTVCELLTDAADRTGKTIRRDVELVPVSRDFAVAQADCGRIWLPVSCWFTHSVYQTEYGFPFPGNILPIFMSFHLARPDLLTDETIAYLKRFAPIGCRDLTTCRLLRDSDISAFVNGCATLSLGRLGLGGKAGRTGRYFADYRKQARLLADETLIEHLDNDTWLRSFDDNITEALRILRLYASAEQVRTPLLHCYLPCRAYGTPVKFTHSNMADPRFEGLIGLDEAELNHLHQRFSTKFSGIMDLIFEGAEPEAVYTRWAKLCAEDMARTDQLIAAQNKRRKVKAKGVGPATLSALRQERFGADMTGQTPVELIFCFDAGFQQHFLATLRSITQNTAHAVSVTILGRHLAPGFMQDCVRLFPELRFAHVDLSNVTYGEVRLLPHISVSTMDRLIVPDLLPDLDRAIYLDVDILVRDDIAELWEMDLGEAAIGARDSIHKEWRNGMSLVYEIAKRFGPDKASTFRNMMFSEGQVRFDAFNAGVLVMDLARLRADDFVRKVTRPVEAFGVHDQFALNIYTRGQRARIPPAWNHFATQELLEDPKLVHFIGRTKPWTEGAYHAFQDEWVVHAEAVAAAQKKGAPT